MRFFNSLALIAFWGMACPLIYPMSGRFWMLLVWAGLGLGAVMYGRFMRASTLFSTYGFKRTLKKTLSPRRLLLAPWQEKIHFPLPLCVGYSVVLALLALGNVAGFFYMFYQCFDWPQTLLLITGWALFGLQVFRDELVKPQGWRLRPWVLLLFAGYFGWATLQKTHFTDIIMSTWGFTLVAQWLGGVLKLPRWLVFLVFSNTLTPTLLMAFYIDPMVHEVPQVTAQTGVRLIRSDPALDFRWVLQGCQPGEFWMGTRKMMGTGPDDTTLQRNEKGFVVGGDTADNGTIDCRLHLVMPGDVTQYKGRLFVVDERTGKLLNESQDCLVNWPGAAMVAYPPDQGWIFRKIEHWSIFGEKHCRKDWGGITGVVYLPQRGWLFGSKENDKKVIWMDVSQPGRLRQRLLPYLTTHMALCRSAMNPCLFTAYQTGVRRHEGPHMKPVAFYPRRNMGAGPTLTLDEPRNRLYVGDWFTGDVLVLNAKTLKKEETIHLPMGVRFIRFWPGRKRLWAANFMNGVLYEIDEKGQALPILFMGRKPRWMNLTHDQKGLLWCSASACYEYRPGAD